VRRMTARGQMGWGIWLTLVKGLADAHGGMVKVESDPKRGTTFTVDIPPRMPRLGARGCPTPPRIAGGPAAQRRGIFA
jgi:nitrogen-specific signal transduction histidine kinase